MLLHILVLCAVTCAVATCPTSSRNVSVPYVDFFEGGSDMVTCFAALGSSFAVDAWNNGNFSVDGDAPCTTFSLNVTDIGTSDNRYLLLRKIEEVSDNAAGILGCSRSEASALARIVLDGKGTPSLSPLATSPALSASPAFFRTLSSGSVIESALDLVKHLGYHFVSLVLGSESNAAEHSTIIENELAKRSLNLATLLSVPPGMERARLRLLLQALSEHRVIVSLLGPQSLFDVLDVAYELDLVNGKRLWISMGFHSFAHFFPHGVQFAEKLVYPAPLLSSSFDFLQTGAVGDDLAFCSSPRISLDLAALSFDATLSLLRAVELAVREGYPPSNHTRVVEHLKQTNFLGATGVVRFDEDGNRISDFIIHQIQNGVQKSIFTWKQESGAVVSTNTSLLFHDSSTALPPFFSPDTCTSSAYRNLSTGYCEPCQPHHYNPSDGVEACKVCDVGSFLSGGSCQVCGAGQYGQLDENGIPRCVASSSSITGKQILITSVVCVSVVSAVVLVVLVSRYIRSLQLTVVRTKESARTEREMAAFVFHELRNPLNGVVNHLAWATEKIEANAHPLSRVVREIGEDLHVASACSKQTLDVLHNILDFSRLVHERFALNFEPMNLCLICEHAVGAVQSSSSSNVELTYDVKATNEMRRPDGGVWVYGDESRFLQVLLNLLANSMKFTEDGFVKLVITVTPAPLLPSETQLGTAQNARISREDEDAETVVVQVDVLDTGIGLTQKQQQQLFQPFSTNVQGMSSGLQHHGTGLGLHISKRIVHLMNSEIVVESPWQEASSGSRFSFQFETWLSTSPQETENEKKESERTDCPIPHELSILVVDDIALNRKILLRRLALPPFDKLGWHFEEASTGEEVVQLIVREGRSFDLVIIDENLSRAGGELTGSEAALFVKKNTTASPVFIGCTGNADNITGEKRVALDVVWTKPVPSNNAMSRDISSALAALRLRSVEIVCPPSLSRGDE